MQNKKNTVNHYSKDFSQSYYKSSKITNPRLQISLEHKTTSIISKKFLLLILSLFLISPVQSQTLKTWMDDNGLITIAKLAHFATPVSINECKYQFLPDKIRAFIKYDLGFTTIIDVNHKDGIFVDVEVVYENHWYPTFDYVNTLANIENSQTDQVMDPRQKQVREFYEKYFNKSTTQFNKYQLATGLLYFSWINHYDSKSSKNTAQQVAFKSNSGKFDEIYINANNNFREKIKSALQIIKWYDSYLYDNFFTSQKGYHLVQIIEPHTNHKNGKRAPSTVKDKTILLSPSLQDSNYIAIATTIVHELTHLHQYEKSDFRKKFKLDHSLFWTFEFSYSPKKIADFEIQAYEQANRFLAQCKNIRWQDDLTKKQVLKQIKYKTDLNNSRILNYEMLYQVEDHLNNNKIVEACKGIDDFGNTEVGLAGGQDDILRYYFCNGN